MFGKRIWRVSGPRAALFLGAALSVACSDTGAPAAMLAPVVARVKASGHDVDAVLAAGNVQADMLSDPTQRVTLRAATLVWQAGVHVVRDPHFGLNAALQMDTGDFDVLVCLARSAENVEQALRLGIRYARLLDETLASSLRVVGPRCVLSLGPGSRHYLPAVAEYVLARLVLLGRQVIGEAADPVEVWFAHRRPRDVRAHRDLFRAPLRFERPEVALVLNTAVLQRPLPAPDPMLQRVLEPFARDLAKRAAPAPKTAHRVRDAVVELLPRGVPSRALVARRLGIGSRTLARWLDAEGTTYSDLVDDLRADLATRYLQQTERALSDIACELGFRDQSAFTKFFKRWVGVLPSEYRRERGRPTD